MSLLYIIVPKNNNLTVKEVEVNIILNELKEIEINDKKEEKINNLLNKNISAFDTQRKFKIIDGGEKRSFQQYVQCKQCSKCFSKKNCTFGHSAKCRQLKNKNKIKIDCVIKDNDKGVSGNVIKLNENKIKYRQNENIMYERNENEGEKNESEWKKHEENKNEESKNKDTSTLYIVVPNNNDLTVRELEINIILNELKEIEIGDNDKKKINVLDKKINSFITQRKFRIIDGDKKRSFQKYVQCANCNKCFSSKKGTFGHKTECRTTKMKNKKKIIIIIKNNDKNIGENVIKLNKNDIKYRMYKKNEEERERKENKEKERGKEENEEKEKEEGENEEEDNEGEEEGEDEEKDEKEDEEEEDNEGEEEGEDEEKDEEEDEEEEDNEGEEAGEDEEKDEEENEEDEEKKNERLNFIFNNVLENFKKSEIKKDVFFLENKSIIVKKTEENECEIATLMQKHEHFPKVSVYELEKQKYIFMKYYKHNKINFNANFNYVKNYIKSLLLCLEKIH